MYICPLKQTGFFIVSLRFPLVIPVEELSIGREAGWDISVICALPGTRSTGQVNRRAGILVLGSNFSPSGWLLSGSASAFHAEWNIWTMEMFSYWICKSCSAFSPLTHCFFLFHPGIGGLCITEVFHFPSMWPATCWEKVNPGKTCCQFYLSATEVWSAVKVNTLFCIFCPQKVTQFTFWKGKNRLAHTVVGHRNIVTGCLPHHILPVYNSSLKTETQTQVFNYRHVHPNLILT